MNKKFNLLFGLLSLNNKYFSTETQKPSYSFLANKYLIKEEEGKYILSINTSNSTINIKFDSLMQLNWFLEILSNISSNKEINEILLEDIINHYIAFRDLCNLIKKHCNLKENINHMSLDEFQKNMKALKLIEEMPNYKGKYTLEDLYQIYVFLYEQQKESKYTTYFSSSGDDLYKISILGNVEVYKEMLFQLFIIEMILKFRVAWKLPWWKTEGLGELYDLKDRFNEKNLQKEIMAIGKIFQLNESHYQISQDNGNFILSILGINFIFKKETQMNFFLANICKVKLEKKEDFIRYLGIIGDLKSLFNNINSDVEDLPTEEASLLLQYIFMKKNSLAHLNYLQDITIYKIYQYYLLVKNSAKHSVQITNMYMEIFKNEVTNPLRKNKKYGEICALKRNFMIPLQECQDMIMECFYITTALKILLNQYTSNIDTLAYEIEKSSPDIMKIEKV
jgi:hypothetical protein